MKRVPKKSGVDGKFIGDKPVDRIHEGLKVEAARRIERNRLTPGETDPWKLNPARKV